MANELFNRGASLTIGKVKGAGKKYAGFRITFEVEKTSESAPNPAKVSIYNLSKSSRAELEAKGLTMILNVGYSGIGQGDPILSQLFIGDVKKVLTTRQGPDVVTTLEAGDGEVAIKEVHVEQSFAPFTPVQSIIGSLADKLGLAVGTIVPGVAQLFENGFSMSGLASDNLDKLTSKLGLEWHVTDGELNVLDPALPTAEPAVLLTKDTGLIGVPSKREEGVEFASLLNPAIKPGRLVSLISEQITGAFRPRKCRYKGDTHGGDWNVTVEAI